MFGLIGLAAFGIIMTIVKIVRQQGRACPRCAGCPEAVRTISCQGNQIAGDSACHASHTPHQKCSLTHPCTVTRPNSHDCGCHCGHLWHRAVH